MKVRANKSKRTISLTSGHIDIGFILNRAIRQMETDLNTASGEYSEMLRNEINTLSEIEHSIQCGDYFA